MARVNKKSRIKGLPPKLLLQAKDSHSGSFPTKFRTASDGKNGSYDIFFDDTRTINFVTGTINLGSGVQLGLFPSGSHLNVSGAFASGYVNFGQDMSSSITGSGAVRKGIADAYISFDNQYADSFEPFKEHTHIDSKTRFNDSFHATGSSINEMAGEDFTSPLWSKTKIVIDLTPKVEHSVAIRNFTSGTRNHPMMYWNNDLKVWEGIGTGKEFSHADYFYAYGNTPTSSVKTAYEKFFYEQTIGFGGGLYTTFAGGPDVDTNRANIPKNAGSPIDNFLFPVHNKFHATSSNCINMSNYIDKPFVLEKVVLEISCAYNANRSYGYWNGGGSPTAAFTLLETPIMQICNFFILNQTNGKKQNIIREIAVFSGSNTIQLTLSASAEELYNNSSREMITWGDICHTPTATSPYTLSNQFVQEEYALLDESTITVARLGQYYSRNNLKFSDYTYNLLTANALAAGVFGSLGREVKFGNTGYGDSFTISEADYATAHPEFNSVAGADGTLSGQNTLGDPLIAGVAAWNKKIQLSMSCKAPIKKETLGSIMIWDYNYRPNTYYLPRASTHGCMSGIKNTGRGFNNKPTGRDFKNSIKNSDANLISDYSDSSKIIFGHIYENTVTGITQSVYGYNEQKIANPYLLLPTDNLVFGWQLPVCDFFTTAMFQPDGYHYNFAHTLGPQFTFAPSPSKITLYGSYIKEGKEHHDTLNQHLTSDAIHEIIG